MQLSASLLVKRRKALGRDAQENPSSEQILPTTSPLCRNKPRPPQSAVPFTQTAQELLHTTSSNNRLNVNEFEMWLLREKFNCSSRHILRHALLILSPKATRTQRTTFNHRCQQPGGERYHFDIGSIELTARMYCVRMECFQWPKVSTFT